MIEKQKLIQLAGPTKYMTEFRFENILPEIS